jgi:outer membrane lipoprotein-sorting protein
MKKVLLLCALVVVPMIVSGCAQKCEVEPIIEENHKLIVPPNFGNMPK